MLSACSTWPNVMLCTVLFTVQYGEVMLLQLLFSTPRISWPMLIYLFRPFDSLPCITNFIIITIFFRCVRVSACICVFKLSVFDDVVLFLEECGGFCTCVCSFTSTTTPTTTIILLLLCFRLHRLLTAIILFSFFNFRMITIIYRRPSLKSNLQQFRMQTMEFSGCYSPSRLFKWCGHYFVTALWIHHTVHCEHILTYIRVRLFALLFHYLFAC